MIFMENGIPMIKPMKKNKPSASGSKTEGNQVCTYIVIVLLFVGVRFVRYVLSSMKTTKIRYDLLKLCFFFKVVVNMTMHEWERIVAALRLTKAMIPPPGEEKRVLDEIN